MGDRGRFSLRGDHVGMTYLILTQPENAANISEALWRLSATAGSSTRYAVAWITHPTTGDVALHLGTGTQYLQPNADIDAFLDLLPITAAEQDAARLALEAARGQRLSYAEMVPPSLQPNLRTHEQMDAAGWFA